MRAADEKGCKRCTGDRCRESGKGREAQRQKRCQDRRPKGCRHEHKKDDERCGPTIVSIRGNDCPVKADWAAQAEAKAIEGKEG